MKNSHNFAVALFITVACLTLILSLAPGSSAAGPAAPQSTQELPVVMIALPWDDPTIRIPAPRQFRTAHAPTATFSINYLSAGTLDFNGTTCLTWNSSAQAAFSYAASVWATLINSSVPIRINACWSHLGSSSILGYSGSNSIRDFAGAPRTGTWYNYSLADALTGTDLDPASPDTYITYNNGFSWYFGTDGATPAGQYDFVSVVMHELGHSLNFAGSMKYGSSFCGASNYGCWGSSGYPNIFDRFTENGSSQALISAFTNPSAALGSQLTSDNLYFNGTNANAANGGSRVKIYAPSTWSQGSSYSHLDYSTFAGTANRLMVYAIPSASSIHDPGPVAMGVLKDVGWMATIQNKLYLPLVLNNPPAQAGPTPGHWRSSGGGTEFYVTPDRTTVRKFGIVVNFSGCGTYLIYRTIPAGDATISNSQFSFTGPFYASGTFDSPTAAHGTSGLSSYGPICSGYWTGGPFSWSTTWQDSSQAIVSSVVTVNPDIVEQTAASGDFHTATIDK